LFGQVAHAGFFTVEFVVPVGKVIHDFALVSLDFRPPGRGPLTIIFFCTCGGFNGSEKVA
ncbi:MAG: hypothetical protein ACKO5E_22940, partial [bacterium]